MRLQNCSTSWGKVVTLITVHCRSPCMNVYGLKNLAWNTGGSLGQHFSHWPSRWSSDTEQRIWDHRVAINDTILQLQQKEVADNIKRHWWRDPSGFRKLYVTFKNLLVLKNLSLQYYDPTAKSSFCLQLMDSFQAKCFDGWSFFTACWLKLKIAVF